MVESKEKYKILVMATLLGICCVLIYYFHLVFSTGVVFTHFFYIPIIMAALWWKRKGLAVAIFLAGLLIFSHFFIRAEAVTVNDLIRAPMFIIVGLATAILRERIVKAHEKTTHLNAILRSIRNVNQLIVREKDRDRLIQRICENLIETRGYYSAWIALVDENLGFLTAAEAGLGESFTPVVEMMKRGEFTRCGQNALEQSGVMVVEDVTAACADCPLVGIYARKAGMAIRLEYRDRIYGILSVSIPAEMAADADEQLLFNEVAGDIALALRDIELEEARKLAEEALRELNEELEERVTRRTAELTKANEQLKQEITERKRAEEVLSQERNRAQKYLGVARVMLVAIDADQRVSLMNKKGFEVLGYKEDEVIGKNWFDTFIPERIRDEVKAVFVKLMAGEIESVEYFENPVLIKSGEERIIAWHNTILRDEAGNITGTLSSGEDVTEYKKANEALKESEEKFRTFMESASDLMHIADNDVNFTYVNESMAKTLGYSKEEMIGMPVTQVLSKETLEKDFKPNWEKFIKNGEISLETTWVTKNGKEIYGEIKVVAVQDNNGKYAGSRAVFRDLTERKRAEDQIKASLKEKEVLLREIHHRVKNNLQIISSLLNLQAMKAEDKKVVESLLDTRSRIQTMSLIHTQLYQSENLERIEMGTTIRKLVNFLFQIYAEAKKNITSVVTAEDITLPISLAIPCGLIINELVSNALKHAFKGMTEGSIEISMRELADDRIKLAVKDNGVGIPEEIDFYKTDTFGLKIVRTLAVDQLKGKMGLIGDEGTEFYIEFDKSITNDKLRIKNYELGSEKK